MNKKGSLSREDNTKAVKLIDQLLGDSESIEFRQPVDWKSLGLDDYPLVIKKPMDLTSIKSKLKKNKYADLSEVYSDLELIWQNCRTYNVAESAIVRQANNLQKLVKKCANKLQIEFPQLSEKKPQMKPNKKRPHSDSEQEDKEQEAQEEEQVQQKELTFVEKVRLAEKVRKLPHDALSNLVTLVGAECPKAIEELDKDRIQIKVDDFDRSIFQKAEELCDNYILQEPTTNKKQKKSN